MARAERSLARTLYDVTHLLTSLDVAPERVRGVLALLRRVVPYDVGTVLDARPGREPELIGGSGLGNRAAVEAALRRWLELLGDHVPAEPTLLPATERVPWAAHLAVPLVGADRVIGILLVARERGEAYGEDDLRLVSVVAGQLAAYLTVLHLYTQAQLGLRLRDAVLAMVSHDLKNPLAAIRGYAQLLERLLARLDAAVPDRARLVRSAAGISAGSSKMARQIEELLDAARLGAGETLELRRRPVDLVALAGQVLAQEAQATGRHRLSLDAAVPALVGEWDPERLERVLANLVSNAVKYSAEGTEIRVRVEADGGEAVVSVRDEGIGIPAADIGQVFGPFRRAGNVAGHIRGSGLGLTSARAIVEQHGGTIDVRSEEGKGSTFRVRLPLREPGGDAADGGEAGGGGSAGGAARTE